MSVTHLWLFFWGGGLFTLNPGWGVLPIPGILWVCLLRGWVRENFVLQKGPFFTFCLTKGCLFGPKMPYNGVHVSQMSNLKDFLKCTELYVLRHFLVSFFQICLTKGSNLRHWHALLKGGVSNLKIARPYTKIGEEPPRHLICNLSTFTASSVLYYGQRSIRPWSVDSLHGGFVASQICPVGRLHT